jgi:uncharacterized membrane protein YccC
MADPFWQRTGVRQTAQVAVGSGLSIVAGSLISGQRWYWALIAAFIVGIGAGSRGEAIVKGLQRLVGTLAGVLVGIALATLVSGHTLVAAGLALVFVFCAFYAFQAAYGTMIFFITLMLALLYGMLGQFKPELLVLRLEETAAGAVIGMAATTFVLPIRQRTAFKDQLDAFLDAMRDSIDVASGDGTPDRDDPIRKLQQAVQDLRNAVGALKRGWLRLVDRRYLLVVRAGRRCAYLTREATYGRHLSADAIDAVQARLGWLRARIDEGDDAPPPEAQACDDDLCRALMDAISRLGERWQAIR